MFGSAGTHGNGGVRDGPLGALARRLEAEQERWFCWLPVCIGGGIAVYFALPARAVAADGAVPGGGDARLARIGGARSTLASLLIAALLAGSLGFALAKLRVEWVRAPVLTKQMNGAEVRGFVELIERTPGTRPAPDAARHGAGRSAGARASRRACASPPTGRSPGLQPGTAVRLRATLMPPAEPALPGDYDFGRQAWFAGIGAVGYALSPPSIDAAAGEAPADLRAVGGRAAPASGHRRAHRRGAARRDRRHRHGADHRRARRHLRGDQRCLPRQRHPAHPVDLRPPHGDHGRLGVLRRALGARRVPVDRAALPDQEVGGGRAMARGLRLSADLRRRLRHRALDDHDLHHVHRRAARPPGAGPAQRHAGGDADPHRLSRKPVRRRLPDVVRRRAGARLGLRGAAPARAWDSADAARGRRASSCSSPASCCRR